MEESDAVSNVTLKRIRLDDIKLACANKFVGNNSKG